MFFCYDKRKGDDKMSLVNVGSYLCSGNVLMESNFAKTLIKNFIEQSKRLEIIF